MPTFVKIEKGIVKKDIFDRFVGEHKDYVRALNARGHQAKTGYWAELGGGMLIFTADSLEDAKDIIAQDPLIINECVTYELHEWCIVVE